MTVGAVLLGIAILGVGVGYTIGRRERHTDRFRRYINRKGQ